MKTSRALAMICAVLLSASAALAQVVISGSATVSGSALICAPTSAPTLAAPTLSPAAGTYGSTQYVSGSGPSGATLCYTTDGTTPTGSSGTCTHGSTYTAPITVASTTTVKMLATQAGFTNSSVTSATYTIQVPQFSPAGGTYSSDPTVTISGCGSQSIFYTTDGSPATIASTLYSGPISVNSTTTINAICATAGAYQPNTQASTAGSTCQTASGGTYSGPPSVTCTGGGGVGTVNPTNVIWSIPGGSSPEVAEITAPASSGSSVQALFKRQYGGGVDPSAPTCDSCTKIVKDITFTVMGSGLENQEHDSAWYDYTHQLDMQNGFQCQGYGSGAVIAVDSGNAGGHWTATPISCSTWTNGTTHHIIEAVSRVIGDTGCGGNGCANYLYMWMDGTNYTMGGSYGGTQGYSHQTTAKAWGWQFQPDMKPTGSSPATGGWTIIKASVALGYGDESGTTSATYTISPAVAAPSFSTGSGSVAAGTTVTASDATSGATIYYTMTTDGTTPPDPTYDSTTYMPAANSTTFIYGTAGTSGITAGNTFVSGFNIYGSMKIKMLAAKAGMSDSSIVSASYTLNAPTGTAIASCGMLPSAAGTYYLTGNLNCPGTGLQFGGINQKINLNGYTLTYGTANGTVLSGTDATVSSGSTTVSCSSCTFTSAMVNDIMLIDNYNQGGFSNNGSSAQNAPLIASVTDSHHVVLSAAPGFTQANAEYGVYTLPVYGVLCNKNGSGGADCTGGSVYNGTITQGSTAPPYSWAIAMQPASFDYPAHGNNTFANLIFNISGIEAEAVEDGYGTGGDQVMNNVINDSVTKIYYRDGLPYPINLNGNQSGVKSPIDQVHDNQILGSPQGGVYMYWTTTMLNNYIDMNGTTQYANGFGAFLAAANSIVRGNSINGYTQGIEEQASNTTMQNNYVSIVMHDPVQDPNHNAPTCELGYGFREKDFGGSGGTPLSGGTGTPLVSNVLDSNVFNDDSGSCGVNDIEFSLTYGNDTTSVTNNVLSLNMSTSSTINPSEIYGIDETNAAGITYSGNTNTISGTYAADGYAAYVNYDQAINWTLPLTGLTNPALAWRQGSSGINTTATFTGTGTPTCFKITNTGSTSTWTATFNGTTVNCPQ